MVATTRTVTLADLDSDGKLVILRRLSMDVTTVNATRIIVWGEDLFLHSPGYGSQVYLLEDCVYELPMPEDN